EPGRRGAVLRAARAVAVRVVLRAGGPHTDRPVGVVRPRQPGDGRSRSSHGPPGLASAPAPARYRHRTGRPGAAAGPDDDADPEAAPRTAVAVRPGDAARR